MLVVCHARDHMTSGIARLNLDLLRICLCVLGASLKAEVVGTSTGQLIGDGPLAFHTTLFPPTSQHTSHPPKYGHLCPALTSSFDSKIDSAGSEMHVQLKCFWKNDAVWEES